MSFPVESEPQRPLHPAAAYALTLAMVAVATAVAIGFERQVNIPNLSLVFVLPVLLGALAFGWGPALAGAVAGVAAYNFFLVPPVHTFVVADPANVWALVLLGIVGAITSAVAAESRRRARAPREAARQARALQELARALVGATDREAVAGACAEALHALFQAPSVVLIETPAGLAVAAGGEGFTEADREAAAWSLASRLPTRGGEYPAEKAGFDVWPLVTRRRQGAVLGVASAGRERGGPGDPERLVEVVSAYLSVALDREALAAEVLEARVDMAGEALKADLLAAVSHDLKTPLSTIMLSLQSVRTLAHDAAAQAELLALAETEAARLERLVEDLLDTNRLDAGAVRARLAPEPVAHLIAAALAQAGPALAGRRVEAPADAEGPTLNVDAGLFESALAKVLENAGRYGPEGSLVRIRTGGEGEQGWVEVEDEGLGFPDAVEPLFGRFTRGAPGDGRPPGLGLGLSIARGFMSAMGGRIEAANRSGAPGARVRLIAPSA